ncbi:hypothetical protein [Pectobacterium phage CX5]|uniref:Uncharacterized protein n=1 Tax=Pectobacterium phage CX5 TaxID=2652426 RepID=A0A5P8D3J5_9CAUD|nr:hypothetical protein [Pectobacterium phage CX5]QFP93651.1 hypothetical protein [Pectobacterium phage CX5-1]
MGYAKKLQKRFTGLSQLQGGALQKRRDKLNRAGVHTQKQRATFDMTTRAKEKRRGCSTPPRGL